eukprot:gene20130-biopygen14610
MGPEVGPAFQRRSRDTPSSNISVRLAETVSRHRPVGANELIGYDRTWMCDREQVGHIRCWGGPRGGEGG